ncbi:MAG: hypothetical protein RDV48_09590 [Candidatus Eremiobacteraeota bacterium]|nr:hypothetical protein [Candidatus Eremiobacteraeota bacterium]
MEGPETSREKERAIALSAWSVLFFSLLEVFFIWSSGNSLMAHSVPIRVMLTAPCFIIALFVKKPGSFTARIVMLTALMLALAQFASLCLIIKLFASGIAPACYGFYALVEVLALAATLRLVHVSAK